VTTQTTFKLIKGKDFIKVNRTGRPDLEESKKTLVQLATLTEHPADYDILIDCRDSYGHLSYSDIYEIVQELRHYRSAFRNKIALLTRPDDQFDKASFMEMFGRTRGFKIGAFTNFEETINWLSEAADVTPHQSQSASS
jgi:hypothetical protein